MLSLLAFLLVLPIHNPTKVYRHLYIFGKSSPRLLVNQAHMWVLHRKVSKSLNVFLSNLLFPFTFSLLLSTLVFDLILLLIYLSLLLLPFYMHYMRIHFSFQIFRQILLVSIFLMLFLLLSSLRILAVPTLEAYH